MNFESSKRQFTDDGGGEETMAKDSTGKKGANVHSTPDNLFVKSKKLKSSIGSEALGNILDSKSPKSALARGEGVNILTQENVGIRSYISSNSDCSFSGIIKHRFNDFHVHEIDMNGQVVVLTCTSAYSRAQPDSTQLQIPKGNKSENYNPNQEKEIKLAGEKESISSATDNQEEIKIVCNEIGSIIEREEFSMQILEFLQSFDPASSVGVEHSITCPVVPEKEKRTSIHNLIRKLNALLAESALDSKTINSNEIIFTISKKSNRQKKQAFKSQSYPAAKKQSWSERGEYCHFTLFKENKDTIDAITLIAKLLRVDAKLFTFCGTKDKRGVTSQRVSAYRVSIERLVGLNKTLRGCKLGNFSYEKERLQLGDSKGNQFTLVIREVKPSSTIVSSPSSLSKLLKTCIDTLSQKGFINYFGMQRFGSRQVSTHKIGACLLSGQWQEACHLILGRDEPPPRNNSNLNLPQNTSSTPPPPDFFSAKTYLFDTWDIKGALDRYPRYCTAERSILNSLASQLKQNSNLARDKWNYLQAIQSITRNLRLMYVHAYQSRVWNEMVSMRHEKYGMRLVAGDLVRLEDEMQDDVDMVQDQDEQAGLDSEERGGKRRGLYNVKVLQPDDDFSQYSIYNLVLPLPGTTVTYPENMKKEYSDFMATDGFDPLNMQRRVKDVSLPGFYRCVYALPANVKGELKRYSDQSIKPVDFILTDFDKLTGPEYPKQDADEDKKEEGDLYAFVLEFGLSSSQYATMLLREIMKTETSASFQSTLSLVSKDHLK